MKKLLFLLLCCFSLSSSAAQKIVNVYIWADYLPNDVVQQFERETGIKVNVSLYDSNEALYAKLKASGEATYDLIFPSNYYVKRLIKQSMVQKLDKKRLTNLGNLDERFLNQSYDPNNVYTLPYMAHSSGIVVNKRYIDPKSITRWRDLWQPRFANQLLVLNDTREVFSMSLMSLGYSVNDTNPEHLHQAFLNLKKLLPNVRLFNTIAQLNIYLDEDIHVGMGWSGEASLAHRENPNIEYIFPQDGFILEIDSMALTRGARHPDEAYQFMNFLLRPDIAKTIATRIHYVTPNREAVKLMPKELASNPIMNPSDATLARGQMQQDLGRTIELLESYWSQLKAG